MQESCIQCGRSMVEMLGVLSIIGVLSIGGIAGYSKAMKVYRINKTMSDTAFMVSGIKMTYQNQPDYSGISANLILNAKLLPKNISYSQDSSGNVVLNNYFGGKMNIMAGDLAETNDDKAFVITYTNLPREACVKLILAEWGGNTTLIAEQAKGTSSVSDLTSPEIKNSAAAYEGCNGSINEGNIIACIHGITLKAPPTVAIANLGCKCYKTNTCSVALKFQ